MRLPWRRPALTAAATILQGPDAQQPGGNNNNNNNNNKSSGGRAIVKMPETWQREVWDFYDELGEFRQGNTWKANMLSRVRLRAAKVVSTQDEPEIIDEGAAHDLVRQLGGSVGGQSGLMSDFAVYLGVPGECYMIGETIAGKNKWYTRSIEEVRASINDPTKYEVKDNQAWRKLPDDSLVVRVFRAHKRWANVADSPARAARPLLRELELVNRHIQAQYISRLASAGIIVFPDDITFPVRPEFADAPDPFVAEWIEVAAEAIATPGTAASVVPIPIKVPGEYIDKVKHIDFTLKLDDTIIQKRDSALSRLAIELDMPPEALLGTRDVNHWNAWLIDEQGVKIHVAPDVEVICDALTVGYLHPMLKAAGEPDPEQWVVWYDASELILRPDRSGAAQEAYDRVELTGKALRRELGFDESDAPKPDETRTIILKKASLQPINTFQAMKELGFKVSEESVTPTDEPRPTPDGPKPVEPPDSRTPPQDQPKNENPIAHSSKTEQLAHQGSLMHAIKISLNGWQLLHPAECQEYLFGCPVTHATWRPTISAMPGTSGTYRVWLNEQGQPCLGERIYNGDTAAMLETPARPLKPVGV